MIISQKLLPMIDEFSVVDVGSLGGGESVRWAFMGDRLRIDGFDPNALDCERLNRLSREQGRKFTYHPDCLAAGAGTKTLHITNMPDSSSLYHPAERRISRWKQSVDGHHFFCATQTVGEASTMEVKTTTLDQCQIRGVDFIKLDVQGAELDVLRGAEKTLDNALAVESEVEFVPLYDGQPLFADVDAFLRAHGFMFFNFHFSHEGIYAGRMASPIHVILPPATPLKARSGGQLTAADAFYMRDPLDPSWPAGKVLTLTQYLKLIIIAEHLNQLEFAFELLASLVDETAPIPFIINATIYADIMKISLSEYSNQRR